MSLSGLRVNAEALRGLPDGEREAVEAELRVLEREVKKNPLLAYQPHPRQVQFHQGRPDGSWPRSRLFLGGNRSGKTTSTMTDTIVQCVDPDVVPSHLQAFKRWEPPFYSRVVGPDLTRWLEGVALQKFREWCPRDQLKGGSFDRAWDKQQMMLRFKNESWVQFMSNDQDLDKFAGSALHRVVYDEEPRADIRRECLMRLIDYGGEELFGMTPTEGMSWVYDEFFEPWEAGATSEDVRIVVVDMDDNPHLDEASKEWALSGLGTEERQARKSGRFVSFSGLIYSNFSAARHVIPAISAVPPGIEIFNGIDPGIRHMCAVLYCYLDETDDLVVFDEIPAQGMTIKQVCAAMSTVDQRWGVRARWAVIDPASKNKNSQTGRSDQQEFADHGRITYPGQNSVTAGINRVKERLDADRLHICANCTELRSEFKKYRWIRDTGRSENEARDRPVKKDDHLLDALRYVVMQRPLVPERDRPRPTDTYKDRLLRASLKRLGSMGGRGQVPADHFAGPGVFS